MAVMRRLEVLEIMRAHGLVPTVNAGSVSDYLRVGEALLEGGIPFMEILLRPYKNTPPRVNTDAIYEARRHFGDALIVGAGTVQTSERAQGAIDAGAEFLVSNLTDEGVIKIANLCGVLVVPGARDDSQVRIAMSLGVMVVKLFMPMPSLGIKANLKFLSEFRGIFPRMEFIVTGGVDIDVIGAFLRAGYLFVVPSLGISDAVKSSDWASVTQNAKLAVCEVVEARTQ